MLTFFPHCFFQRVNQCLQDACTLSQLQNCRTLIDCGEFDEGRVDGMWVNDSNSISCFDTDKGNFSYGIYQQAVLLTTQHSAVQRYIYALFWGFQQISTLAGNLVPSYFVWEVLFTMAIIGAGLLLFALLIGNMQNFLQSLGRRRLEMQLRRRDVERWMSHRRLPEALRSHTILIFLYESVLAARADPAMGWGSSITLRRLSLARSREIASARDGTNGFMADFYLVLIAFLIQPIPANHTSWKVRQAERFTWAATRGINEEQLLENLPEDIQREIHRHFFGFLNKVRIFTLMDEPMLDAMYEKLKHKVFIRGSNIFYKGGPFEKMVFIVRGKLESIGADENIAPLAEGDVCGEELLTWYLEHSSVNRGMTTSNIYVFAIRKYNAVPCGNCEVLSPLELCISSLKLCKHHVLGLCFVAEGGKIRFPGSRLLSTRTVRCLTNVEAFALHAGDLEEVTTLFSRFLRNPRVQGAISLQDIMVQKCFFFLLLLGALRVIETDLPDKSARMNHIRYESPYWRNMAATRIQVAWRYRQKRLKRASITNNLSANHTARR
ncbi:hypothetical protein ZIOFF_003570 [Zingiber officinale]|uniref:Cyclic nucleotide-binding domain-containing protein n=1 Tax=Zingiber officinale TaxID=94328 RepID=A0A8J5ITU5_ZINOF|nr:hypothetical protein ZIOFF_003570 [Zingiber officinale]